MVFDKPEYRTGEEASALITFPEPVEDALLSLERDKVEATALLSKGADWLRLESSIRPSTACGSRCARSSRRT